VILGNKCNWNNKER